MRCWPRPAIVAVLLAHGAGAAAQTAQHSVLDRVASAVDGVESSHGQDPTMWRPDPSGPQGPMQVSAAAATDVGGGDRFDAAENQAIGRAYLEQLYRRYRNWPDAIVAYNWGIGHLNAWRDAGRPADKLAKGVAAYTDRVLRDSGLCAANQATGARRLAKPRFASRSQRETGEGLAPAACEQFAGNAAGLDRARWRHDNRLLVGLLPDGFYQKLEDAITQTSQDLLAAERR
jgi:Transglycosylase SLT domain